MSKVYKDNESWVCESDNGIRYSIYEAVGDGTKKHTHSDIYVVILDDYYEDYVNTEFVSWGYGYELINQEDEDYINIVKGTVADFERSHPLIVKELGKDRPFIDNEPMMCDFFYYDRREFLNKYSDIRDRDYDATAKLLAKKITEVCL